MWTVVRGLQESNRLDALTGQGRGAAGTPEVLLWGVGDDGGRFDRLAEELRGVCSDLGENPSSLSEPDVVLTWDGHVVFVEAKYRSPNELKPDYHGFAKYLGDPDAFRVPPTEVIHLGLYELVRNWVIGAELAQRRESAFTLINLGGRSLASSASKFVAQVGQTERRRFVHRRWREVLDAAAPMPQWLDQYARDRGLPAL